MLNIVQCLIAAGGLLVLYGLGACEPSPALPPADSLDNAWVAEKLADKRVLWVAPHADDEVVVSPVLAEACVYRGARCVLLVTTDNTGWCPYGPCSTAPDTGMLRLTEHRAAAQILNAKPAHLRPLLPSTNRPRGRTSRVVDAWRDAAGGSLPLIDRFVRALEEHQPDVVISHDPRHGNYCHPEHRVTAALVLEAVKRSGSGAEVLFVASSTRRRVPGDEGPPGPVPFVDESGLLTYDASWPLSATETGWAYVKRVTDAYPSQYSEARRLAVSLVPPRFQRTFLIPAAAVSDVTEVLCENP